MMIAVFDYANDRRRVGVFLNGVVRWHSVDSPVQFARVMSALRKKIISKIAVTFYAAHEGANRASWSLMRTAVTHANTLAFATGASVLEMMLPHFADDEATLAAIERVSSEKGEVMAAPRYDKEPNITRPKS